MFWYLLSEHFDYMKIRNYIALFLFTIICSASGHLSRLDSLKLKLSSENNIVAKATILNKIAEVYQDLNPDEMLKYATLALQSAKQSRNNLQIGFAFLNLGNANIILGNYDNAIEYFHNAKNILESNRTHQSTKDYQNALKRLEVIFDSMKGSPEGDELEILGILIEKYEDEHFPIGFPDPIEAIKFRMEQLGYNQTDLAKIVGLKSRVSEILNKKRKLTIEMIRLLHENLKIPTEVLIQAYE